MKSVFRPLLIPVYLAEYEDEAYDGVFRSCTVFMNAASSIGGVCAYRNPQSHRNEYDNGLDELARSMGFQSPHNPDLFSFEFGKETYVASTAVSISPPRDICQALIRWVDFKMRDPAVIEEVAKASVIEEDSDPRIREYDPRERAEVEVWMDCGAEEMMTRRILDVSCVLPFGGLD